jgi:hypothetical protein
MSVLVSIPIATQSTTTQPTAKPTQFMKFSIAGIVSFFIFIMLAFACGDKGNPVADKALSSHQKLAKDFVDRVLLPELKRAEAVAGDKENWLPESSSRLDSIVQDCSSPSINAVDRAYESAQSMTTHAITVQEIVNREKSVRAMPVKERYKLLGKYKVAYYPKARLICDSISSSFDKLFLASNQTSTSQPD